MKILLLDNYDSFTYNLKILIHTSAPKAFIEVRRNKDPDIKAAETDILVISPGPMSWKDTGILKELFVDKIIPSRIPVLGICLGMQFIAGYFGSEIGRIGNPEHGICAQIRHNGDKLFDQVPSVFEAARYNSLGLYDVNTGSDIQVIARENTSGAVMALKHNFLPMAGFQFHPESFLSECGRQLIKNFMTVYVQNKL